MSTCLDTEIVRLFSVCSRPAAGLDIMLVLHLLAAHCTDQRPPPGKRKFVSPAVDGFVADLSKKMTGDPELACLLRNTLPNTLDTTVRPHASGFDAFIVTGDIDAMWLRDSTNQVAPYLRFARSDGKLAQMLQGLVRRQTQQILLDPYANAFTFAKEDQSTHLTTDETSACAYAGSRTKAMHPGIYERKFEVDSPLSFLQLSCAYHNATADAAPFDTSWLAAVASILDVFDERQLSSADAASAPCGPAYQFSRLTSHPMDTLLHARGPPAARTGMLRSAFRPSDDACVFSFHIPSNAMATVVLRRVASLLRALAASRHVAAVPAASAAVTPPAPQHAVLQYAKRCDSMAAEIEAGIYAYGLVERRTGGARGGEGKGGGGAMFAYEVDGFGNALLMGERLHPDTDLRRVCALLPRLRAATASGCR